MVKVLLVVSLAVVRFTMAGITELTNSGALWIMMRMRPVVGFKHVYPHTGIYAHNTRTYTFLFFLVFYVMINDVLSFLDR